MMYRWAVVLATVMVLAAVAWPGWVAPARAGGPPPGLRAGTVSHGLEVTLSVPQRAFPHGSLVRATLVLRNVSTRPLVVDPEPEVEVLDHAGRAVYSAGPGTFPQLFTIVGPFLPPPQGIELPLTLRPGRSAVRHVFLVLKGARLRAAANIVRVPRRAVVPVRTGSIRVSLVRGLPPRIRVTMHVFDWEASVRPARPIQRGTLWYVYMDRCGNSVTTNGSWSPADVYSRGAYRFWVSCAPPTEWHLAVAWLNQTVAYLNYVTAQPRT